MSFSSHVFLVLLYGILGFALSRFLPGRFPTITPLEGALVGGNVFLACALLHSLAVHLGSRRRFPPALPDYTDVLLPSRPGPVAAPEVIAEKAVEKLAVHLNERPAPPQDREASPDPHGPASTGTTGTDKAILDSVRNALKIGRVDLLLQPIVSLPQRKLHFFECFSRIRTDDAILSPDQYIGIAEKTGLIGAIDTMLLFRCVQLVRKNQKAHRNLGFFCNVSTHTIRDKSFFNEFVSFMALNSDLASSLVFEFAQSDLATLGPEEVAELGHLSARGFTFSMDQVEHLDMDFEALARNRIKFLKVSVPVLRRAAEAYENLQRFKDHLNRLAIDLIADKIETEKDLLELLDQPVDFGQGYYLGEPRISRESA